MHLYSGDILAATGGGCSSSLSPRSFHWASNKRHILAFIGLDHHHHHHHLHNHHQQYHNPFVASQSELNSFTHRLIYHHDLHSLECPRYVADQQMSDDDPGPRIVPSCHPGWGAVSDLGGSFAECGFKIGHRHCGTTTRAIKTAPYN